MTTRVIVCGSISFLDRELCFSTLDEYLLNVAIVYPTSVEIVSGHARGADSL